MIRLPHTKNLHLDAFWLITFFFCSCLLLRCKMIMHKIDSKSFLLLHIRNFSVVLAWKVLEMLFVKLQLLQKKSWKTILYEMNIYANIVRLIFWRANTENLKKTPKETFWKPRCFFWWINVLDKSFMTCLKWEFVFLS